MTHVAASREALAKALRDARMTAYEDGKGGWLFRGATPHEQADALIASGAVIDASTLAEDEALVWSVAQHDYDMHAGEGSRDFDDDWVTQAEQTLRALAAALADREQPCN